MNKLRKIAASIGILFVALSSLLSSTPASADDTQWWAQENWENDVIPITIPDGWEFYEIRAWYGSPTDPTCGADVSQILTDAAKGQTSYTIYANNNTFGDPCPGVYKVFRFTWSIVPIQTVVVDPVPVPTTTPVPVITDPPVNPGTPSDPDTPTDSGNQQDPGSTTPVDPPVVVPVPVVPPATDPGSGTPVQKVPQIPVPAKPPVVQPTPVQQPITKPSVSSTPTLLTQNPSTIDPQSLTPKDVTLLQAVANQTLNTSVEGSPEYNKALEQLAVAAKADDIQVDPQLAATPVIGAVAVGVTNAINALGNIGADMSPVHRATAKKEVVAAVVVTQVAVTASGIATQAAASAAGAAGVIRRKN